MITARLQCIINHVCGETIADIGTDHAYVPVRLIEEKRAEKIIASDIRKGPVETARRTVKRHKMEDKIEIRQGAGLSVLKPGEADNIIIAGMGGILISEIINNDMETAKESLLILQPMNCQYELRKYLHQNGFSIIDEDIVTEGFKVYNLFTVKKGVQKPLLNDIDYHLPPNLYNHRLFNALYEKKKREFTKVIKGLENSKQQDIEKLNRYRQWYDDLKKIKQNF